MLDSTICMRPWPSLPLSKAQQHPRCHTQCTPAGCRTTSPHAHAGGAASPATSSMCTPTQPSHCCTHTPAAKLVASRRAWLLHTSWLYACRSDTACTANLCMSLCPHSRLPAGKLTSRPVTSRRSATVMIGCCTTPHACRCPCCTAQLTLCMLLSPCRYLDFMTGHLKEVCNYELKPELRGELETAILHLEVRHTSLPCLSQPPRSPRAPFPASRASTHFTLAGEGSVLRLLRVCWLSTSRRRCTLNLEVMQPCLLSPIP